VTTRITVTTGDGGLLDRNAQQQASARQAALVKAQAEQAAATGAEQQRQRRIAAGLDPATGRPLSSAGSTSRLTRIDQEPAAFRGGEEFFLLRPTAGPTDGTIPLLSRKLPAQLSVNSGTPTFSSNSGPSSAPALLADPNLGVGGVNYVSLTNSLPTPSTSKYANKPLKDYTLQLFVRLGETYVRGQREVDFTLRLQSACVVGTSAGAFRIDMYANLTTVGSNTTGFAASEFEFLESSSFTSAVSVYEGSAVPLSSSDPKVGPGFWHHMAITRQGTTLRAFLDGELLGTATSTVPGNTFLNQSGNFVEFSFGQTQERILPGQTVSIHGLRFDTKCLYTANFTPPPSL
jgi:hypothetical protein